MYDRPFGVEIECYTNGRGRDGTKMLLENHGLHEWAQSIGWDGSEIEIRGPILKGAEGLHSLEKVMNLLAEKGYETTDSDGMHVHFDASDLNESDMIRVIKSWTYNEPVIRKFIGPDRWDYCNPYSENDLSVLDREGYGLWYFDGNKDHAIEPRARFKTLEFRQHYGTLNFEEARAWILLCQGFIKTVSKRKNPMEEMSMDDLFKRARIYKIAQRNLVTR